jgi:hypothetical protein
MTRLFSQIMAYDVFFLLALRIPLNPATHSTGKLPPKPGKPATESERSDAGIYFYSLCVVAVNGLAFFLIDSPRRLIL